MLLDFLQGEELLNQWRAVGAVPTLLSYGLPAKLLASDAPEESVREALRQHLPAGHFDFLVGTGSYLEMSPYLMVHAGVRPGIRLEDQQTADVLGIRNDFLDYRRRPRIPCRARPHTGPGARLQAQSHQHRHRGVRYQPVDMPQDWRRRSERARYRPDGAACRSVGRRPAPDSRCIGSAISSMDNRLFVSIVMPALNEERYVAKAIASILPRSSDIGWECLSLTAAAPTVPAPPWSRLRAGSARPAAPKREEDTGRRRKPRRSTCRSASHPPRSRRLPRRISGGLCRALRAHPCLDRSRGGRGADAHQGDDVHAKGHRCRPEQQARQRRCGPPSARPIRTSWSMGIMPPSICGPSSSLEATTSASRTTRTPSSTSA